MRYSIAIILTLLSMCWMACKEQNISSDVIASADSVAKPIKKTDSVLHREVNVVVRDTTEVSFEVKSFTRYNVEDAIEEDFNGDGATDSAFFKEEQGFRTMYIMDGATRELITIGEHASFVHMGTNFYWVDFWGVTRDSVNYEVLMENGELVRGKKAELLHPSIVVRKEASVGGIVTYKYDDYRWLHQADLNNYL